MVGVFFLWVSKCHKLRTSVSKKTLRTFCEMTRCSATAWSRMCTHYWPFALSPVFSFFRQYNSNTSLPCIVTMAKWNRHWKLFWVPYGDGFKKAYMVEWELEAHASECSGWVPGQRWTEPGSWSWINQDTSHE